MMTRLNQAYIKKIEKAIELIEKHDLGHAKDMIHEAIQLDDNGAEAQNLLGAYYELTGDRLLALRHYRASYALEPSYGYANMNIERLTCNNLIGANEQPFLGHEDLSEVEGIDRMFAKMK